MTNEKSEFQVQKIKDKTYRLDVKGLVCPYPQLLVLRAIHEISSGDILEVILDNAPSVKDIPPALNGKGYDVEVSRLNGLTWKLLVQAKE